MEKTCTGCNKTQPINNFYKDKNRKDGHYVRCRNCQAQYSKQYRARFPDRSTDASIKYKYGITLDQYKEKLNDQGNACAICQTKIPGGKKDSFFIDHDHETGKVRGLLCRSCNLMIGHAKDDTQLLATAIGYLVHWGQPSPR